jgi:TonB-dependent starch-binding outer membrane protein SusC
MAIRFSRNLLLVVMSLLFVVHQGMAQTRNVTGTVTDNAGKPLSGVSVVVKGGKTGTTTNSAGEFTLPVGPSAKTLEISNIGYVLQEIEISNTSSVAVSMQTDVSHNNLNDVVVIGYGTARRKDVTGAVSSITARDFNSGPIVNPMDQVQGRVPGLVVVNADGDPNSNPVIRLRGQTSLLGSQTPLIVVDGIIFDNYELLSSIPPADIVTYDFLKDASAAAIYGSRGANGVIIITTRKGHAGTSQIFYNGSFGVANDAKYYNLLNASSFVQHTLAEGNDTTGFNWDGHSSQDWQKAITQTGYTNNQLITLSGGTENFTYNGSLTYSDQKGIVINTGRKQYGLRMNADQKVFDGKLDIQYNLFASQTDRKNIDANIFYWAYNIPPTVPDILPNGKENPIYNYNYVNPVWMENNEVRNETDYLKQIQVVANYELFSGLKIGAGGNISRYNVQYDYYLPVIPGSGNGLNQGFKYNSNTNSNKGEMHINYAKSFGKSNLTATGVYEYNYYTDDNFYARGNGFPVDETTNNSLSSGIPTTFAISSYKDEYKLISFLLRATYNYDQKYYLTASFRRDGSSKFGANNAWGSFPSVSAAWMLNREDFMKNVSWLDELKINVGYGVTGNSDPIGAYNTLFLLGPNVRTYDPTNSSNPYPVGFGPVQNPNEDLKWEKRIGTNLGFEFAILKSRITGSFAIFNDKTEDMLYNYNVPTPPNYINSVLANVGSLTNKGWEMGINALIVDKKDISWSLGGQITVAHTKITSLTGNWDGNHVTRDEIQLSAAGGQGLSFNPLSFIKVGQPLPIFKLSHFTGIDKATGQQLLDSAGVKSMTLSENGNPTLYYIDPTPKFTYGINTTFRYKEWSLTAQFNGNYGQKVYDNSRLNLENYPRFPGLNVKEETFTNGLKEAPTSSDYWLEKASFLRLQNLTISYQFPTIGHMSGLRVYFTGSNLFVITSYKGLDPEISPVGGAGGSRSGIGSLATVLAGSYGGLGGAGTGQGYLDNNYSGSGFYPRARVYTLGVSLTVK